MRVVIEGERTVAYNDEGERWMEWDHAFTNEEVTQFFADPYAMLKEPEPEEEEVDMSKGWKTGTAEPERGEEE